MGPPQLPPTKTGGPLWTISDPVTPTVLNTPRPAPEDRTSPTSGPYDESWDVTGRVGAGSLVRSGSRSRHGSPPLGPGFTGSLLSHETLRGVGSVSVRAPSSPRPFCSVYPASPAGSSRSDWQTSDVPTETPQSHWTHGRLWPRPSRPESRQGALSPQLHCRAEGAPGVSVRTTVRDEGAVTPPR